MKKILYIMLDGLGDGKYPCKELGNRTPLEAAATPTMNMLAREGQTGLMYTAGKDIAPESDHTGKIGKIRGTQLMPLLIKYAHANK